VLIDSRSLSRSKRQDGAPESPLCPANGKYGGVGARLGPGRLNRRILVSVVVSVGFSLCFARVRDAAREDITEATSVLGIFGTLRFNAQRCGVLKMA